MYTMKRPLILITLLSLLFLFSCSKSKDYAEDVDPPPDLTAGPSDMLKDETLNSVTDSDVYTSEMIAREIYLIDTNGMVVSQTIELPEPQSKAVAEQVLEHLIKDGPITEFLPNGFSAVLPSETEVLGLNLQTDGTLVVDLSEEFTHYEDDDELNILESMTYTLTQFSNVDRIKLRIDGQPLSTMPVNGTPIGTGYSRDKGINVLKTDTIDLLNSDVVTMYYPAEYNDNRYYIPTTQHIEKDINQYESIVETLINGPTFNQLSSIDVFNASTMLTDEPYIANGVLQLQFNEFILEDVGQGVISDTVMETLVRTLTELDSVDAVHVNVDNVDQLVNEQGEAYEKPVSLSNFIPEEKF